MEILKEIEDLLKFQLGSPDILAGDFDVKDISGDLVHKPESDLRISMDILCVVPGESPFILNVPLEVDMAPILEGEVAPSR